MKAVAQFEKISYEQFKKDWIDCFLQSLNDCESEEEYKSRMDFIEPTIRKIYDNIKLPIRSTKASAGHDFFAPSVFEVPANKSVKIPTGIRCKFYEEDWVLGLYPRSGQGFKTGIHLANTVGIVDADYYNADNEGHIFVKLVNDSTLAKDLIVQAGQAFCQGIFSQYGVTVDDNVDSERVGGFGSTDSITK